MLLWAIVLFCTALFANEAWAAKPSADVRPALITLANGDHAAGRLVESIGGDALVWKADGFVDELQFPIDLVQGIRFREKADAPASEGDYCFELAGRDLLYGALVSLDDQTAVIDVGGLGRLHVARSILRRLSRRSGSELVYGGLAGLEGWEITGKDDPWREEAGHLVTDVSGAAIYQDLEIPAQARIEIDLAWNKRPDFQLELGAKSFRKTDVRSFLLEVWDETLVAVCETIGDADVADIAELKPAEGRISLQVFLDQQAGRMLVTSVDGELLADLNIEMRTPEIPGGLRLTNIKGDVRLENLRVYRWDAQPPIAAPAATTRILHADGAVTNGQLVSYDRARNQFVVRTGDMEARLDADQLQGFNFPTADEVPSRSLRAVLTSGMRVSGDLERADEGRLVLKRPGIAEPLEIPTDALLAVAGLQRAAKKYQLPGRTGRLEMGGIVLHGCLVDGWEDAGSCLLWQTLGGDKASRLAQRRGAHRLSRSEFFFESGGRIEKAHRARGPTICRRPGGSSSTAPAKCACRQRSSRRGRGRNAGMRAPPALGRHDSLPCDGR